MHIHTVAMVCVILIVHGGRTSVGQDRLRLTEQMPLARLVDLCAQRLELDLEYEPKALQAVTVTLRLHEPLDDHELWALTNQLLHAHGFATVQAAGSDVIRVTQLAEASRQARLELGDDRRTAAGFVTVLMELEHRDAKEIADDLKALLSTTGGSMLAIPDTRLLLLSDTRPRVDQLVTLIERIDQPVTPPLIEPILVTNLPATELAGLVGAAVTAVGAVTRQPLTGKVYASPDEDALILIAPEDEAPQWRSLIERFDRRQAVERRSYAPAHFPVQDVAPLLFDVARDPSPRGSGDLWQVVTDELTGTLIVTATPSEHEQIRLLLERLDNLPQAAQRPVRTLPIRNRPGGEIIEILINLVDAGVLESGRGEAGAIDAPVARQRTTREVLPPGAQPVVPVQSEEAPGSAATPGGLPTPRLPPRGSEAPLSLTADQATNTLIAVGDPRRLNQLERLIETLDVRQPQVMVEVLVLGLTESNELDLGIELEKLEVSGDTVIKLASLFGLGVAGVGAIPDVAGAGGTALVLDPGDFRILVRALEAINQGRSLNIPKVLVNNNQPATLDSVLQQPFTSTNASNTVTTTSFGGTQDAGTSVSVTPQIAEGDHLVLEFDVSLSTFVGESPNANIPPPRQQNSLSSTATVPDGYTVAVGGLETWTDGYAVSQVPFLGDIPGLGELFKNRQKSRSRVRFYVFITVDILRHGGFEDLKYLSDQELAEAELDDGWPTVEPRIMH